MTELIEQTRFQAAMKLKLSDSRKKRWRETVEAIFSFSPGSVFTVRDLVEKTGMDRTNILHIMHGSGIYRNCPSLIHGPYKILLADSDPKLRTTFYQFNERKRQELAPLLL